MKHYQLKVAFSVLLQVLFAVHGANSQTSPASYTNLNMLRKEMLPPTPTAGALMRYVDHPVSYCTGVPEITIPVYTIKSKLIELPIYFSYNASGIKVDDESSEVGLGWSLCAGGVITKSVVGKVDDEYRAYGGEPIKSREEVIAMMNDNYLYEYRIGTIDTGYDRYTYNFCGYTGAFYVLSDTEIIQFPLTDNKIIPTKRNGLIESFKIITPDGNTYSFNASDYISTRSASSYKNLFSELGGEGDSGAGINTISSWYLTSIESVNQDDKIEFEYENSSDWNKVTLEKIIQFQDMIHPYISGSKQTFNEVAHITNIQYSKCKALNKIKFNGGSIVFYNTSDRTDKVYPSRIDAIVVIDEHGNILQDTALDNNNYFNCGRMKLKSVTTQANGEIINKDDFEYYEDYLMPRSKGWIAHREYDNYFGQDRYGYYNGVNNNSNLVFVPIRVQGKVIPADRHHSLPHAKNLTLKKINNFVGNTTEYIYESNKYSDNISIGIRIKQIKLFENNTLKRERLFEYGRSSMTYNPSQENPSDFIDIVGYFPQFVEETNISQNLKIINSCKIIEDYGEEILIECENGRTRLMKRDVVSTSVPQKLISTYYPTSIVAGGKPESARVYSLFVTEITKTAEGETLKTEYEYDSPVNTFIDSEYSCSYSSVLSNYAPYTHGYYFENSIPCLLRKKTIYKTVEDVFIPVESVINTYRTYDYEKKRIGLYSKYEDLLAGVTIHQPLEKYCFFNIELSSERRVLVSTTTSRIYDNGSINETVTYGHNIQGGVYIDLSTKLKNMLNKTIKYKTDLWGAQAPKYYEHIYKHPEDYNTDVYRAMLAKNCINPAVQEVLNVDLNYKSTVENSYKLVTSIAGKQFIAPKRRAISTGSVENVNYDFYSPNCNLQQTTNDNALSCVYLWGYGGKLIIAKIENATLAMVKEKIGESNLVLIENSVTYSQQQQDLINSLRILIPQAMVTTFVHEPLIGVKSITDHSGRVLHYEFDNAHRLNTIYDEERNIIKAYDYYYKK